MAPWKKVRKSIEYIGLVSPLKSSSVDPWEKSQYRSNEFIAIQLQRKNTEGSEHEHEHEPIWIANYHMPCAFREPAVMTLHCELVAQRIQSLAKSCVSSSSSSSQEIEKNHQDCDSGTGKGDTKTNANTNANTSSHAFVLAGDFNIMPDSVQYRFLTTGQFDSDVDVENIGDNTDLPAAAASAHSSYPPIRYGTKWDPNSIAKMRSAYATYANGKESDFTNYAHNGALSNESFIGTLDYIFLSHDHDWVVKDVLPLKHRDEILTDGPFPNADEPSDHVMIGATLEI